MNNEFMSFWMFI